MLTVKKLLSQTMVHRKKLKSNASNVAIAFSKPKEGKDKHGFYRAVIGSARTNAPDKKTKTFEIRLYWPKKTKAEENYIPEKFRPSNKPYVGPTDPPQFNLDTKAWVFCTCEYFLFHCEVADAYGDSSQINYKPRNWIRGGRNTGAYPFITNPQGVEHICKHLIAALVKGALMKK